MPDETPEAAPETTETPDETPTADAQGEPGSPPSDSEQIEYTGSGEPPADESGPADNVEVVDGEVVPEVPVGVTQTPEQEPGETEAAGEEPEVLDSGDVLPRHRREVEGIE